jgi:CheY-like chemotaxis protein
MRLPLWKDEGQRTKDKTDVGLCPSSFVLRPFSVLVVDDNRDAAESLALLLKALGHEATTAYDGPAAVKAARTLCPDLVICDLGLPGMSGYKVAEQLRALPELREVRLVALTGFGTPEDRRRSREAGFDDHLVKPVSPETLGKVLHALPIPR